MAAKLDPKRPFGTVHGEGTNGACFEQDNKEFDNDGKEIVRPDAKATAAGAHPEEVKEPVAAIVTKDAAGNLIAGGVILDTEALEAEDLRALAAAMGLKLHPMTGKAKALIAITDAAQPTDQLAQQLGE